MNKIEFLSSEKVITKTRFNWKCFYPIEFVSIVTCLCAGLHVYKQNNDLGTVICLSIIGILFGAFYGYLLGLFTATPIKYAMQYKIAILDEAAIPEIKEKYEIVEQNEKLWTIREEITE